MAELRKGYAERITGVIWGLIVTGAAVAAMFALSGTEIDVINVAIVALVALGGWLVVSALVSTRPPKKSADAVVAKPEEPALASDPDDD